MSKPSWFCFVVSLLIHVAHPWLAHILKHEFRATYLWRLDERELKRIDPALDSAWRRAIIQQLQQLRVRCRRNYSSKVLVVSASSLFLRVMLTYIRLRSNLRILAPIGVNVSESWHFNNLQRTNLASLRLFFFVVPVVRSCHARPCFGPCFAKPAPQYQPHPHPPRQQCEED